MTFRTTTRLVALFALALFLAAGAVACGGGGSGDGPPPAAASRTYLGTQSPGDVWSWSLNPDGTFDARNETLGYDYAGTYTTLPSDYLKLIVTSTTEPGMTPPEEAYAIEVPDSALVVKPAGTDGNIIVAVAPGACPGSGTQSFGWVELCRAGLDPTTDNAYGVAAATISGSVWDLTTSHFRLNGTPNGGDTLTGWRCTDGVLRDPLDADMVFAVASSGVFLQDIGPGLGGVIGMEIPAAPIDLSDLTAAGREFRGFHFEEDRPTGDDSMPVWARPDGSGHLSGGEYTNIETNIEAPPPHALLTFDTQASPGIVNGSLTDSAGTSPVVFLVNRLGGLYFVFGISVDSHDGQPYNFVAIEIP